MSEQKQILQLILDMRCNAACYLCGGYWPFRPKLSTSDAVDRLTRAREKGIDEVVLSGGEVTLRADLFDIIVAAKRLGYSKIAVFTNGRKLANPNYAERLLSSGITSLGSTLYGALAQVHEAISRARGSYQDTIAGITFVRQRWPDFPLSVNCVIAPENYCELAAMMELLTKINVTSVQLTFVAPIGKAQGIYLGGRMPAYQQVLPYVRSAVEVYFKAARSHSHRNISLTFFPLCVLGDLAPLSKDADQPETFLANEAGEFIAVSTSLKNDNLLAKRPECTACIHNKTCNGVWSEYVQQYGWTEFIPVTALALKPVMPESGTILALPT